MSANDLRIVTPSGRSLPTMQFVTVSGGAAISAGEPVKINTNGLKAYYVVVIADGDGADGSMYFIGITANSATHTSSADGTVDVYLHQPGTIYAAKPKTADSANTLAKVKARHWYRVVLDVTSSKFTIDSEATDAATNAVVIVGGNPDSDEFYFTVAHPVTWFDWGNR